MDAVVGGAGRTFKRQSRGIVDHWSNAASCTYEDVAGANHFTVSSRWTGPESEMVNTDLELSQEVNACRGPAFARR